MKIGVCVDSTGLPIRQAFPTIARMGVGGVQLDAFGDVSPEKLTETGRRELRNLLKSFDLQLTALNCPLRRGIDVAENQQPRIEYLRKSMTLAFDLGPRMVIVQCPRIPDHAETDREKLMREALLALGIHGDRTGVTVALEIGFDPAEKLRDYLNTLDVGSLAIHYDPANFLINGHDPLKNLMPLSEKVAHSVARDARTVSVSRGASEVPLGAGDIDWLTYVGTLTAIEYRGWIVVKRDQGENRLVDLQNGVAFLKRFVIG